MLTDAQIEALTGDAEKWSLPLRAAISKWSINTPQRLAHWLAQCAHESTEYTRLVESMHYSAEGLLRVFRRRFTPDEAAVFAWHDEMIAERVYGGRFGNGVEGMGDGWKYRGRGLIGITFADNYRACGIGIGADVLELPTLLEQPIFAADSAGWYWQSRGINELADGDDIVAVTKAVNGGDTGLLERTALLSKVRKVLA